MERVALIRSAVLVAGALALTARAGTAQSPATCEPARTALVLGGGGAKGIAHLGVLRTLDSLGIVPDLVVGTSMGAITGALWASGETAREAEARIRQVPLQHIIRDYEPVVSASLGGLTPALVWQREPTHWVLQTGAMREGEVSAAVSRLALRANVIARGDFDRLPIPFRAVATDLDTRTPVAIGDGDLGRALRASMAIPLLLRPVTRDGRALVDGGLSSNVPVGVARAMGAERVIVATIASPKPDPAAFDDPWMVTSALFEFLWVQDSVKPGPDDVVIALPTAPFGMLDFRPATMDSLIALGERTARAALGSARCIRPLNAARPVADVPTQVGRARIGARDVHDRDAVLRELHLETRGPLDLGAVGEGLARIGALERYRGVWLTPGGDSARADFDVVLDPAPRRAFGLGFAFDHTMSGRMWLGAVDHAIGAADLEGTALLTVGTYRTDLTLAARRRARVGERYLPVGGSLEVLSEHVRLYQGLGELPNADAREAAVMLGLRPLYEPGWSYQLGAEYRLWQQPGTPLHGAVGARYAVRYRFAGAPAPTVSADVTWLNDWRRAAVDLSHTAHAGGVEIRPRVRAGWGERLPLVHTFTLGGLDGFAGMRLLEPRGDRELFGSLLVRWPAWRRVVARVEPMAGVIGTGSFTGGPGSLDGVVLVGARVGVELDTPIGPIRIEQGFNNQDRRQALIRVGHWF